MNEISINPHFSLRLLLSIFIGAEWDSVRDLLKSTYRTVCCSPAMLFTTLLLYVNLALGFDLNIN